MKENIVTEYRAGEKALLDYFHGLVPCKVIEVFNRTAGPCTFKECKVVVTKDKGPYKKGEIISELSHYVIPPKNVVTRGYHRKIKTNFNWIISKIDIDN